MKRRHFSLQTLTGFTLTAFFVLSTGYPVAGQEPIFNVGSLFRLQKVRFDSESVVDRSAMNQPPGQQRVEPVSYTTSPKPYVNRRMAGDQEDVAPLEPVYQAETYDAAYDYAPMSGDSLSGDSLSCDSIGGDSSGMEPLICCPVPTLQMGGNAIYWTRLSPKNIPIFTSSGLSTFSANQFDFDYDIGYEAYASHRYADDTQVRFRYLNLDGVQSNGGNSFSPLDGLATGPSSTILAAGTATNSLQSEIMSGELMISRPVSSRVRLGWGFRLLEYDEVFGTVLNGIGISTLTTDVDNHFYGCQFAADVDWHRGSVYHFSSFTKAGIYGNKADQTTQLTNPAILARASDTEASAIVEFGLTGRVLMTDRIAVQYGYSGLYIAGVALGPDQLNRISSVASGFASNSLDMSDVFYHGGFLGIEFRR